MCCCAVSCALTGNNGAPLTQTLSANRTRFGLDRNLARLPADNSVDLRPGQPVMAGWHTSRLTWVSHARTSWMTWSRGASLTSSPLTARIRSPGSSCKHEHHRQKKRHVVLKSPTTPNGKWNAHFWQRDACLAARALLMYIPCRRWDPLRWRNER